MKIYCGKCGGAYDDQFVVCPHCGNIREEQQENFAVEEIKSEPPKSKKKTPKWVKITAVVVSVVIVLTGVLWSTGTLSNIMLVQAGYVRVPSVIGKSREKAKEILTKKKLGLLIIGKMDTDDDMELGLVCEQSPGKGDKAKENADVSVMLSNGPKMGYMPATVYYKVDTATANIEAQGLKAEVKYEYSDEVGKDGVISQSVETNTAVKQGETVKITVSKGSKKESEGTVKMKNLVGMDFETARKELLKDGIYLLVEEAKYDDNAPENQIIIQNDKEGSEIQKGENVFVTISLGKEKVRVPDLVYLEKAEAESKLKELGFTVKTETGSDENTADGLVLEQSAPSGEMLEKGSEITITVNVRLVDGKGRFYGYVKDKADGKEIGNVEVKLIENKTGEDEEIAVVKTNEKGLFSFDIPYGEYCAYFNHDGYSLDSEESYIEVKVTESSRAVYKEVVLKTEKELISYIGKTLNDVFDDYGTDYIEIYYEGGNFYQYTNYIAFGSPTHDVIIQGNDSVVNCVFILTSTKYKIHKNLYSGMSYNEILKYYPQTSKPSHYAFEAEGIDEYTTNVVVDNCRIIYIWNNEPKDDDPADKVTVSLYQKGNYIVV